MATQEKPKTRSIGGVIPEELYWAFKKAQADRRENSIQALEIAIRLYLDCGPKECAQEGGSQHE